MTQDDTDLISVPQLAEILGVALSTAHDILDLEDSPIPVADAKQQGRRIYRFVRRSDAVAYKATLEKQLEERLKGKSKAEPKPRSEGSKS